jgi:hypothetical protein
MNLFYNRLIILLTINFVLILEVKSQWDYGKKYVYEDEFIKSELSTSSHHGKPCYKYIFNRKSGSDVKISERDKGFRYLTDRPIVIDRSEVYEVVGITFDGRLVREDYPVGYILNDQIVLKTEYYSISHVHSKVFYNSVYYKNLKNQIEIEEKEQLTSLPEKIKIKGNELLYLKAQLEEKRLEYSAKKIINDSILAKEKRKADSARILNEEIDIAKRKSLKIGDEYKEGFVIYTSPDSLHGIVISKNCLELTWLDLVLGSTQEQVIVNNKKIKSTELSSYELVKYKNDKLLQENLFYRYRGFRLPQSNHIDLIRQAHKESKAIKKFFEDSGQKYKQYPWVYKINDDWFLIHPFLSKAYYQYELSYSYKLNFNNVTKDIKGKDLKYIVRLVSDY